MSKLAIAGVAYGGSQERQRYPKNKPTPFRDERTGCKESEYEQGRHVDAVDVIIHD
jgi:hypothetical protein